MKKTLTHKLVESHCLEGEMRPGSEIALKIDQTLTQDATGTLVMLELEAMGVRRARTEVSAQYVDHNLLQEDHKNPDDHLFLRSACRRFGVWYSPPGNGVSHPVHQERFGKPGKTLLGSDSHTPAAGSIAMLAIGAGGIEVALAMAGEPYYLAMPKVWGVRLTGRLPDWVSAKDVILEMLRRHGVDGGTGYVLEYFGPGLERLSAMDRHVIANMGAELGATSSVFPSDEATRRFLIAQGRGGDWTPLAADPDAEYDRIEEIDLSALEPLIAMPQSPGNVKTVREVAGREIYQAYVGSSANPGYRDFAIAAEIVRGRRVHNKVSFDINPTSRQILENLVKDGQILSLLHAGARLHQAGCNGCIGMGQAPASGKLSLRTVPRNFPGRSGERDDQVCLVSPETAAASALTGVITDPRSIGRPYPRVAEPDRPLINQDSLMPPLPEEEAARVELEKGPNIAALPQFGELEDQLELPVMLKVKDDVSTDEIMPAGAQVLPFRSNIPRLSDFAFERIDPSYPRRARERGPAGHAVIGGRNYGQGSSREHAALVPRALGLKLLLAKSFARIHWQNLVNFGILPLVFDDLADYDWLKAGETLRIKDLRRSIQAGSVINISTPQRAFRARHNLSGRQAQVLLAGGLIHWAKEKQHARH